MMPKQPFIRDQQALLRMYRQAEVNLLGMIADAAHKNRRGSRGYYQGQLRELRRAMRNTQRIIGELRAHTFTAVEHIIGYEYTQGMDAVGVVGHAIDERAVSTLVAETKTALAAHLVQVARRVDDLYRHIVIDAVGHAITAGATHQHAVQEALNMAANRGLTGFMDTAGRKWGMDTYVDMAVRTARHRAHFQGKLDGWRELGVNLVRISTHPACAPQCQPFQGRVLALDGAAGTRIVTTPDGGAQTVQVVSTMQEALARGYKHPNCRHTETAFLFGRDNTAPIKPQEVLDAEYRAEQTQRHNERQIRMWKRRQRVAGTEEERRHAAARVRAWQERQRQHIAQHEFLTRRYGREN